MNRLSLDGTWSLRYCDPGAGERWGWPTAGLAGHQALAAHVPGDVHLDLVEAGLIPEPLYGCNAAALGWMEEKDWWYSRTFDVPDGFGGDRFELHFAGLDTTADVWLNGVHVGRHNTMFVGCTIDVTHALHPGPNLLVVRLDSGLRQTRGKELARYAGMHSANGAPFMWVRKASFTWEWDWSPRLLTCGIWRSVELRAYHRAALRDLHLQTRLAPNGIAEVDAALEVESFGPDPQPAVLEITLSGHGEHRAQMETALGPGTQTLEIRLRIPEPALWWPAGLGAPDLYDCRVTLAIGGEIVDERSLRYGVRELRLRQDPLPGDEGQSFTFVVNGQPVFCRGANWSPADHLMARVSPAKYRALVQLAAEANFNMFRVNGVGIIEDPYFYDLCDEFGILIWSDFNYSCSYYPDDDPAFVTEARREAELIVRSLRNHPCLALWSGTNENLWHHYRGRELGWAADRCYGDVLYHEVLKEVCDRLDPDCPYWPGSPWGYEADPNAETSGNRHAWQVSIMATSPDGRVGYEAYADDRGKFISEFGVLGPCAVESLQQFLPPDEMEALRLPASRPPLPGFAEGTSWRSAASASAADSTAPAWTYHTNSHERAAGNLAQGLKTYWRPAHELPLDEYIGLGQLIQAEGLRFAIEHWRRRKFLTSGTLFWNYSDSWGATVGWTIVDYYLRKKAAYYAVRRAYAPVLASIERTGDRLRFWLVNDTLQPASGVLEYGLCELPTSQVRAYSAATIAPANGAAPVAELDVSGIPPQEAGRWAAYARFVVDGAVVSRNRLFLAGFRFNRLDLPRAAFHQAVQDGALVLQADTFVWQINVETPAGVAAKDNHFDMFPGEEHTVQLDGPPELFDRVKATALN